jgi:hypothetical protein
MAGLTRFKDFQRILKEGFKLNIGLLLETVIKATRMVVFDSIFVQRIGILAAHFPDEWMELILKALFAHLPQG